MNSAHLPNGGNSSPWDITPVIPADEELPPELPESPAPSNLGAWDKLREFFGCLGAEEHEQGVLAMLREPQSFKSGVTPRNVLAELCGYASELEFFEESQKVATTSTAPWFATPDKVRGGWVIWCDHNAPQPSTSSRAS